MECGLVLVLTKNVLIIVPLYSNYTLKGVKLEDKDFFCVHIFFFILEELKLPHSPNSYLCICHLYVSSQEAFTIFK